MVRRLVLPLFGAIVLVAAILTGALLWMLSGDRVRLALEEQASAWLGEPVSIGRARASLLPRLAVRLDGVRVGDPARLTLTRVDLSTGLRPLLSRRLEDVDVIVSSGRVEMPLPFAAPEAPPSPAAAITGAAAAAMRVESVRRISLRDVMIIRDGQEAEIELDSSLEGSRLSVERLIVETAGTALEARGHVDLEPRISITLEAAADELDIDGLLAAAAAFADPSSLASNARRDGPALSVHVTSPLARTAGVELTTFDANVTASAGEIVIEPLAFEVFGGRHEGRLAARLADALDVRFESTVAGIDVAELTAYGGAERAVTGTLSGTGSFDGRGPDLSAVLAAARGTGEVSIVDGEMRGLDLVRTIVLFFGRPASDAPPSTGARFERITGTFALAERRVTSDDLTLESQDVAVLARGGLDLPTKALSGRADLVLSESLSAQAGTDLSRLTREGNRIILPATIGGTLDNPQVGIDVAPALQRGIQNELRRRLDRLLRGGANRF